MAREATTFIDSRLGFDSVKTTVLTAGSLLAALVFGFTLSLIVSPDPTGLVPLVVGLVLTGVLTPVFYLGTQRLWVSQTDSRG